MANKNNTITVHKTFKIHTTIVPGCAWSFTDP